MPNARTLCHPAGGRRHGAVRSMWGRLPTCLVGIGGRLGNLPHERPTDAQKSAPLNSLTDATCFAKNGYGDSSVALPRAPPNSKCGAGFRTCLFVFAAGS